METSPSIIHWHDRGYLPHFEGGQVPQSLIFRLNDSLPKEMLLRWKKELVNSTESERNAEITARIEDYLDIGAGARHLADARVADVTQETIVRFNGKKYLLHAWVVMPNHVHTLITPCEGFSLSSIVHSWKSFTAKAAKKILGLEGAFWQPEYFDRAIRNDRHFYIAREYIENNPVKAGLVDQPDKWP